MLWSLIPMDMNYFLSICKNKSMIVSELVVTRVGLVNHSLKLKRLGS